MCSCIRSESKAQSTEEGYVQTVREREYQEIGYNEVTKEGVTIKEPIILTLYERETITTSHGKTIKSIGERSTSVPAVNSLISKGIGAVIPGLGGLANKLLNGGLGGGKSGDYTQESVMAAAGIYAIREFVKHRAFKNNPRPPVPPAAPQVHIISETKRPLDETDLRSDTT